MNTPRPFYWNRSVDFYRELRRMPDLLNATVASGSLSIEFNECRDALKTLYDESPSLIPFITKPEYSRLTQLVHEAADRYNAYLALLRQGVARERTLDEINEFYNSQLVGWTESVFLDFVAGIVVPTGDDGPEHDIIEATQQLFELKPNIAGIGINLNALITWLRSRGPDAKNARTKRSG
jgi:hypothetical protein